MSWIKTECCRCKMNQNRHFWTQSVHRTQIKHKNDHWHVVNKYSGELIDPLRLEIL